MSTVELSVTDLRSIQVFTISLARKAGALILEGSAAMAQETDVGEKKNSVDLVTDYDVRVEELVKHEIASVYPSFKL
jgi:myo-inositol-1(or 4)-monophosphatase